MQVAREHAQNMAQRHYANNGLDHLFLDGFGPDYHVSHSGYPLSYPGDSATTNYIESIAAGNPSAEGTWIDWMNSPPHKHHLLALQPDGFRAQVDYGVGYANVPGSQYQHYWVVITANQYDALYKPALQKELYVEAPLQNAQTINPSLELSGSTDGATSAALVRYRVESGGQIGAYQNAIGTTHWTGIASGLVSGRNTIRIQSLDANNVVLVEVERNVQFVSSGMLSVSIVGDGGVSDGLLGTTQQVVGGNVTITATPSLGSVFTGWSGSFTSQNPTLSFSMTSSVTVTATFVQDPSPQGMPGTLTVSVVGQGSVNPGFLGNSQRSIGAPLSITATPSSGSVFAGWSGGISSPNPTLPFTMSDNLQLTATFVPDPFPTTSGTYTSIFEASGSMVRVTLAKGGSFTVKVQRKNSSVVAKAKFAHSLSAMISVRPPNVPSYWLQLQFDPMTNNIFGMVTEGGLSYPFTASARFQTRGVPFAKAGRYTVALSPDSGMPDPNAPRGDGVGSISITKVAGASLSGFLADGRPIIATGTVGADGKIRFYKRMYAGKGLLAGSLDLVTQSDRDLDGSFRWIKPVTSSLRPFPAAFDTGVSAIGAKHAAPKPGAIILDIPVGANNSSFSFDSGGFTQELTQPATLTSKNRYSFPTPLLPGLSPFVIAPSTGMFKGSFTHPIFLKKVVVRGVLIQKMNLGFGHFVAGPTGGAMSVTPAP